MAAVPWTLLVCAPLRSEYPDPFPWASMNICTGKWFGEIAWSWTSVFFLSWVTDPYQFTTQLHQEMQAKNLTRISDAVTTVLQNTMNHQNIKAQLPAPCSGHLH